MKVIQVKYMGPTNTKGSRLKLSVEGWKPVIESLNYALSIEQQAQNMASTFARDNWQLSITGCGSLSNGDFVYTIDSPTI